MAKLVSSTYGEALFELALETDRVDDFLNEIQGVEKAFSENEELLRLLNHPKIIKEEKLRIIRNIFSGWVSEETVGFLHIIVKKDRQQEIPGILSHFIHLVKEHKGIGTAYVTSATELSGYQKKKLRDKLLSVTSYVDFDMNYQVDSSLLGGLVIRIEDRIVDSSLKTQLDKLKRQLGQIQLHDKEAV